MLQKIMNISDEFSEIKVVALSKMTVTNQAKYNGFWDVSKKLNSHLGSIFDVDHATSIKQSRESSIANDNLQILVKGIAEAKNSSTWVRFTYWEQHQHIMGCATVFPNADLQYVQLLLKELQLYWY